MKNVKKTYLLIILLLSLGVPGYACFPDTVDGWAAWCEDNGISYEVGTSADALEFYYSSDLYDRELPTLTVTAPPIYEPPYVSPFGQPIPYEPPTWTPYDPTTPTDPDSDPKDCAGVEGGSAYLDNCQECVGGSTGKDPCDCEGNKCPICGGLVVIVSQADLGLMKVAAADSKCRKCTCIKWYPKECDAYKQMFDDAIANKHEYLALITPNMVYTWKAEDSEEGSLFGPFSPIWDSNSSMWYIVGKSGERQYIYGVAHVHWDPKLNYFSPLSEGDYGSACTLHGVPLYLFTAQGNVQGINSTDGKSVRYIDELNSFTVQKLKDCNLSLVNLGR